MENQQIYPGIWDEQEEELKEDHPGLGHSNPLRRTKSLLNRQRNRWVVNRDGSLGGDLGPAGLAGAVLPPRSGATCWCDHVVRPGTIATAEFDP
jgi:hypothetical protein